MRVKRVAQGIEGRVNIGLSGSYFLGPFPQFIQHFRAMRPEVDVVLHAMAPAQQLAGIRGGRLDLSFERGMPTQEDLVAWLCGETRPSSSNSRRHCANGRPCAARPPVRLPGHRHPPRSRVGAAVDSCAVARRTADGGPGNQLPMVSGAQPIGTPNPGVRPPCRETSGQRGRWCGRKLVPRAGPTRRRGSNTPGAMRCPPHEFQANAADSRPRHRPG